MRKFHSQFRVLLFTLAIGLAAVWMWNGVRAGREYVHVDIPSVQSGELIQVFGVEHRWMPIGGGSAPDSPNVSSDLEERGNAVVFKLSNYLRDTPIYVASTGKGESLQIPFFLECLSPPGLTPTRYSPAFVFSGQVTKLDERESLEIRIQRPEIKGRCWISVPYSRDTEGVRSLFGSGPFDPIDRMQFDLQTERYASEPFFNR